MKKIITIVALAATLISAQAFAQTPRHDESRAQAAVDQAYSQAHSSSNFQNQWNDGNW